MANGCGQGGHFNSPQVMHWTSKNILRRLVFEIPPQALLNF
jgi:hypothetical protein